MDITGNRAAFMSLLLLLREQTPPERSSSTKSRIKTKITTFEKRTPQYNIKNTEVGGVLCGLCVARGRRIHSPGCHADQIRWTDYRQRRACRPYDVGELRPTIISFYRRSSVLSPRRFLFGSSLAFPLKREPTSTSDLFETSGKLLFFAVLHIMVVFSTVNSR